MTTAQQIVNRAAEVCGYKDAGETLSGTDSSNFLGILNDLLGSWNTDRLYILSTQTVNASVSASPVSIGAGQTLNTSRPTSIEDAWVRSNGVDFPLEPLTSAEYDAIAAKGTTGTLPASFYYQPSAPNGAIYLYPAPSTPISLFVRVATQLTEFADLTTSYDLGPGYKRALEYSLAEELPGDPSKLANVARIAANARRAIRRANFEPVLMETGFANSVVFNVLTGE